MIFAKCFCVKLTAKIFIACLLFLVSWRVCGRVSSQGPDQREEGYDVFSPIGKYIIKGNADCLSAWFDDNLEITVNSQVCDASKAQARQIVKDFFDMYTPQAFQITHTASRANMKYALGSLKAGGGTFMVTIFVSSKDGSYKIQQLKIENQ